MARSHQRVPESTPDPRRLALTITATLLGGMIAVVAVIGSESLEPRLTANARAELTEAGFGGVDVRFDGREAFISSATASEARLLAAERVVERVEGVRWVTIVAASEGATPTPTQPSTPTPTATPPPPPDPEIIARLTSTEVLFAPDSVRLTEKARMQLAEVAALLEQVPSIDLTVTGHIAIPTGSQADAIAFSERRAQAVVDELIRLGIPASRLSVVGAGTGDAVGDNDTAAGAARNRRVTFSIRDDG